MKNPSKPNRSRHAGPRLDATRARRAPVAEGKTPPGVRPEFVRYGMLRASQQEYPSAEIIKAVAERMLAKGAVPSPSQENGGS